MGGFVTVKHPNAEIVKLYFRLLMMFEGPHCKNFL